MFRRILVAAPLLIVLTSCGPSTQEAALKATVEALQSAATLQAAVEGTTSARFAALPSPSATPILPTATRLLPKSDGGAS
jgi:hypothetical protein